MFKRDLFFIAAIIITITGKLFAQIPLARNGQAVAEIVLPADAPPPVRYAAEELQLHVELISGAKLPILQTPGTADNRIVLAVAPDDYEDDVRRIGTTDGYAVRTDGNTVTVFGAIPKGVLNGAYKLLTRNSDLIWARPDPKLGTIFTRNPDLTLTQTDWIDIPVYVLRGWQISGKNDNIWQIRHGNNWAASYMRKSEDSARFGMILEHGGGHNLTGHYITGDKYFEEHPEYFPFSKGVRQDPRTHRLRTQLCFSNSDMTAAFIRELDARIAQAPDYDTYRIMIEDTWQTCECPECVKPLTLEDGTTVEFKDGRNEDFRSTQFFLWLNTIARHFQKNYPDKRILTFAYFFTEIPPRIKVEPNISISFCPISKNSKKRIDEPGNEKTLERFHKWIANTPEITWREYFGLSGPFPRPMDAVAIYDWNYVNRYGVKRTYSEMCSDASGGRFDGARSWDVNAPYFWVMATAQDVDSLRNEFFTRVYGAAASDIKTFYALIEKSFLTTPGISRWNDNAALHWRQSVVNAGLVDDCRAALDRAAAKGLDGKRGAMLTALREVFNSYVVSEVMLPRIAGALPLTRAPKVDGVISDGEWQDAVWEDGFVTIGKSSPAQKQTQFAVGYTRDALFFAIQCDEPDNAARKLLAKNELDIWRHDAVELFIQLPGEETFFQFLVSATGHRFGLKHQPDKEFADTGWTSAAKDTETGYDIEVKIPFKLFSKQPRTGQPWRFNVARTARTPNADTHTTWAVLETNFHETQSFGSLLFIEGNDKLQVLRYTFRQRFNLFKNFIQSYRQLYRVHDATFASTIEVELEKTCWAELCDLSQKIKRLNAEQLTAANAHLDAMQAWSEKMEHMRKEQSKKLK